MAEDNIGFDPLESLGNDYGKINGAGLDTKSFQPFEGDRIETPEINFGASQKFYPVYPAIENLDRPNRQIKATVANSLTNTPNKKNAKANTSTKDILKAFGQMVVAKSEASQSVDDVAKMYAYDASPSGNAFYKRYAAYGQEKFDAIGFHPLRDNEANFNARTTKWDDWSRMMTHSFWPLFGQGFTSAPKSMAKLIQFDFSSDVGEASEYEEAAAIGQSSKGGAFGFINNTAMNFGYTAGIITEAVAEELVGLALAAPTGGASLFAATANNARKAFSIGKGLDKAVDGLNAINDTIGAINNVSKARSFWTATKAAAASKVGRVLNPLDNTFDAYSAAKKVDNITNLAVLSKTAGGFYRDVRNINMALAEGRLEAGMVQNHVYDKLYNEAYEKTGLAPSDQEQQYMRQQSKEASANTLFWNTGLIYLSNKVTFDNITGPRGGLRNFMKSTVDDAVSIGGGKFGTLGKVVYDKTAKAFEFQKNNVIDLAKSWWKNPGYKTAAKTIGYMKGNFSEGIQENLQEVIAGVNERYYIDTFNSKGRRSLEYAKGALNINKGDYFNEELGKQFSAQGFETFASGFVMGMPAGVLNNAMPFLSTSYNRIFNKDEYTKYKDNKLKITKDIVKSLNDIDINDFLNSRAFNYGAQDVIAEIKQSASKKEALDAELEGLTKAMTVMVNSNTTDIFIDKLKAYGDMNDNEFMDAMKLTDKEEIPKYRERVNRSIGKIEKLKKRHDFYSEKFINPVKLEDLEGLDKTSDEYKNAVSLHHGWNLAVENAVFLNESFEDNMNRMSEIQTKFLNTTSLKNTGQREMGIIFQPAKLGSEIELLTNEIKSLTDAKDTSELGVKKLKSKKLALKTLTEFKTKHDQFELFYNRSDYYEQAKQKLKKDLGRLPTDQEITDAIDKQLGKIDDVEKQVKYVSELKLAFNEYLQHIATTEDDVVFDSNLDAGFKLLLEHYKLGLEGKNMVKYINTLHDPNNFSDLARRNQEWMKNLYESKAEYYENMIVKPELKNVEDNALLNRLASRNIYVSEADLIKWREEGIIPTEFFDNTNKKVIPKGSPEYEREVALFKYASALQDESEDISNEIYGEELQIKINNLNAKEIEEIDALPKVETKVESRTIRKNYRKSFSINDINDNVKDGEFVDLEYKDGKEIKTITLYKDNGDLKLDNVDGVVINLDEYKFKYKSGLIYKIKLVADEVEVELIKSNYNGLRKKAVKESKVKPVAFKPITKDTPINEYDENLQQKLFIQHEEFVKANPEIYKDILDDEEAFDKAFTNYIHTNPEAIKLVDEYNAANTGTVKEPVVEGEEVILTSADIERKRQEEKDELDRKSGRRVNSDEDEAIAINIKYNKLQDDLKQSAAQTQSTTTTDAKADIERRGRVADIITSQLELGIALPEILDKLAEQGYVEKINNSAFFKQSFGRDAIVFNIDGAIVPIYRSSQGTSSKTKGKWYPFFFNAGDWLVKGMADSYKDGYNNPIIKQILDSLNNNYTYDKPIATVNGNNKEVLSLLGFEGFDEENNGIYDFQNYLAASIVLKDWQSKLGNIDVSGYQEYLDGALSEVIKVNPTLKSRLESAFKIVSNSFVELTGLEEQGSMNVGKGLSPKAETKFAKLGFTQEMIDVMSDEEIEEAKTFNAVDDAEIMRIMLTNRLKSLGIEVPEITEVILNKKDKLVAKKDIFIKDETGTNVIFVEANGTATITKINEKDNTVNLKVGNKKGVHTFKIDELNSLFNLNQVVMNDELVVETPEFIPTTEEKIILEESNGNIENFMDKSVRQKEIEAEADKLTDEELDNDILNDLDCK